MQLLTGNYKLKFKIQTITNCRAHVRKQTQFVLMLLKIWGVLARGAFSADGVYFIRRAEVAFSEGVAISIP